MLIYSSALLLLLMLPLFGVFFWWRNSRRKIALDKMGDERLIANLISSLSQGKRRRKNALWMLAIGAIIIALSRPMWGIDEDLIEVEGIAVMVVLDVSASMNAQDISPSRLERAKLAARELFEQGQGNQIGLILFAGNAFVQFPLTTDTLSAITFLDAASTSSISRQGTALEDALRLAINSFDERTISNPIIVLMTDGENHEGQPLEAAEDAADQNIVIHTIGFGDIQGAPVPELDVNGQVAGYKSDAAGNIILSQIDEETLQEVAAITGGTYQRAGSSGIEIVNLLNSILEVEKEILEKRSQTRQIERFSIFVAIAVLALLAEMFLSETKS